MVDVRTFPIVFDHPPKCGGMTVQLGVLAPGLGYGSVGLIGADMPVVTPGDLTERDVTTLRDDLAAVAGHGLLPLRETLRRGCWVTQLRHPSVVAASSRKHAIRLGDAGGTVWQLLLYELALVGAVNHLYDLVVLVDGETRYDGQMAIQLWESGLCPLVVAPPRNVAQGAEARPRLLRGRRDAFSHDGLSARDLTAYTSAWESRLEGLWRSLRARRESGAPAYPAIDQRLAEDGPVRARCSKGRAPSSRQSSRLLVM